MISRRSAEAAAALLTCCFGAVIAYGAGEYGVGWSASGPLPGAFPFAIGLIIVAASLGNLAKAMLAAGDGRLFLTRPQLGALARFVLPIFGFVLVAPAVGLYVATFLYLGGMMRFQGGYSWSRALIVSLAVPIGLYLLIERIFEVGLLKGPLEAMLGL